MNEPYCAECQFLLTEDDRADRCGQCDEWIHDDCWETHRLHQCGEPAESRQSQ